jgi:hypothetical protein
MVEGVSNLAVGVIVYFVTYLTVSYKAIEARHRRSSEEWVHWVAGAIALAIIGVAIGLFSANTLTGMLAEIAKQPPNDTSDLFGLMLFPYTSLAPAGTGLGIIAGFVHGFFERAKADAV